MAAYFNVYLTGPFSNDLFYNLYSSPPSGTIVQIRCEELLNRPINNYNIGQTLESRVNQ